MKTTLVTNEQVTANIKDVTSSSSGALHKHLLLQLIIVSY